MREALRNPSRVLTGLGGRAAEEGYQFRRLYRNLYNQDLYRLAGERIHRECDGADLDRIIAQMRSGQYRPGEDGELVQQVLAMLLERIYGPAQRDCRAALERVRRTFGGAQWFIEGGAGGCFARIDGHALADILRARIRDEQFIALIWKFMRAGCMERWQYDAHSGAARGSVLGQMLADVYMGELDALMAARADVRYCRCADDFLIGVMGRRADADAARDAVRVFLGERMNLWLPDGALRIVPASGRARFLGYDVTTSKMGCHPIRLCVPMDAWRRNLLSGGMMVIRRGGRGAEIWSPSARSHLVNRAPTRIVGTYSAEIRGLCGHYALADNAPVLAKYRAIAVGSLYHTLAAKYRCTSGQAKAHHRNDGERIRSIKK